jgi:hypothetical protein
MNKKAQAEYERLSDEILALWNEHGEKEDSILLLTNFKGSTGVSLSTRGSGLEMFNSLMSVCMQDEQMGELVTIVAKSMAVEHKLHKKNE